MNIHHLIQFLVLPLVVLFFAFNLKNRLMRRILTICLFSAVILMAIIPGLCDLIASFFGCAHPLSPLLYMLTMLVCCLELSRLYTARQNQEQLTEIVRKTTLANPERCSGVKK